MLSVKNLDFSSHQTLWETLAQHRKQFARQIEIKSHERIPEKIEELQRLTNTPIQFELDGKQVKVLPLIFAIWMRDPEYVQDLLHYGADIYHHDEHGFTTKSAVEVLNDEIDQPLTSAFYDLRLSLIRKSIEANALWRDTKHLQFKAILATPFLAVGLVYIGHFPLFHVYFTAFLLYLRDHMPVFGASWNFFKFGDISLHHEEHPQIKSTKSNVVPPAQKQIFNILRYGLYFASYSAVAMALISYTLYGALLTFAISTEVIRQSMKLYYLRSEPYLKPEKLSSPELIGSYYNHRSKVATSFIKLLTDIAYTATTFAWCFSPGGISTLLFYVSLYTLTYCLSALTCHMVDNFMFSEAKQMIDCFYQGDGSALTARDLADTRSNRIHQFFARLFYSYDMSIIKGTMSYLEHLLHDHPYLYALYDKPRQAISYALS